MKAFAEILEQRRVEGIVRAALRAGADPGDGVADGEVDAAEAEVDGDVEDAERPRRRVDAAAAHGLSGRSWAGICVTVSLYPPKQRTFTSTPTPQVWKEPAAIADHLAGTSGGVVAANWSQPQHARARVAHGAAVVLGARDLRGAEVRRGEVRKASAADGAEGEGRDHSAPVAESPGDARRRRRTATSTAPPASRPIVESPRLLDARRLDRASTARRPPPTPPHAPWRRRRGRSWGGAAAYERRARVVDAARCRLRCDGAPRAVGARPPRKWPSASRPSPRRRARAFLSEAHEDDAPADAAHVTRRRPSAADASSARSSRRSLPPPPPMVAAAGAAPSTGGAEGAVARRRGERRRQGGREARPLCRIGRTRYAARVADGAGRRLRRESRDGDARAAARRRDVRRGAEEHTSGGEAGPRVEAASLRCRAAESARGGADEEERLAIEDRATNRRAQGDGIGFRGRTGRAERVSLRPRRRGRQLDEGTAPRARRPSKEIDACSSPWRRSLRNSPADVRRPSASSTDGSRSIDEKELSAAVAKLGIHMDNASLLAMQPSRPTTTRSSAAIDFEEFEEIVNKANEAGRRDQEEAGGRRAARLRVGEARQRHRRLRRRRRPRGRRPGEVGAADHRRAAASPPRTTPARLALRHRARRRRRRRDHGAARERLPTGKWRHADRDRAHHPVPSQAIGVPEDFYIGVVGSNYYYGEWEGALNDAKKGGKHAAVFHGKDGMLYAKANDCYSCTPQRPPRVACPGAPRALRPPPTNASPPPAAGRQDRRDRGRHEGALHLRPKGGLARAPSSPLADHARRRRHVEGHHLQRPIDGFAGSTCPAKMALRRRRRPRADGGAHRSAPHAAHAEDEGARRLRRNSKALHDDDNIRARSARRPFGAGLNRCHDAGRPQVLSGAEDSSWGPRVGLAACVVGDVRAARAVAWRTDI